MGNGGLGRLNRIDALHTNAKLVAVSAQRERDSPSYFKCAVGTVSWRLLYLGDGFNKSERGEMSAWSRRKAVEEVEGSRQMRWGRVPLPLLATACCCACARARARTRAHESLDRDDLLSSPPLSSLLQMKICVGKRDKGRMRKRHGSDYAFYSSF
ncbi:hypothetical protein DM02DRAFT_188139 [Periconia macrospinosa]|uniref:Uncharacterized protein n=1 Tax=Periconia macrospinosa TaxID=97972 RepID=A0A2V1E2L5_9PLEO|nr:hypothetical protein DM02DRAFT_188139 [Periconia macrospinosa]